MITQNYNSLLIDLESSGYQIEERARKDLCRILAQSLGMEFEEPKEDDMLRATYHANHSNGASVSISAGGYRNKGKVTFGGRYPRDKNGEYHSIYINNEKQENVEITCSLSKGLDKIKSDFEKRFLPTFLEQAEVVKAKNKQSDDYQSEKRATLQSLATALEIEFPCAYHGRERDPNRPSYEFSPHSNNGIASIRVNSPDSVQIVMELNKGKALKLIELLKSL